MLPIDPLMVEHRLIERMINQVRNEIEQIELEKKIDIVFIDAAIDFIKIYADMTHHGKEENILFRDLSKKQISKQHQKIMNELIDEHKYGRKLTQELVRAKEKDIQGQGEDFHRVLGLLNQLVEFYPEHIRKEDKHFFIPCMDYFSQKEKEDMLQECWEFDRKMIHEKYKSIVEHWSQNCPI